MPMVLICTVFTCYAALSFFFGINDTASYDEDLVIVLGCATSSDEDVSSRLESRLNTAIEYSKKNPSALIIVSGGIGSDKTTSEAMVMERFLISKGIPGSKVIREENSHSTYDNFAYSKKIADSLVLKGALSADYKVCFITNDFHVMRAAAYAENAGLSASHMGSPTPLYMLPASYVRECLAFVKFLAIMAGIWNT